METSHSEVEEEEQPVDELEVPELSDEEEEVSEEIKNRSHDLAAHIINNKFIKSLDGKL